MSAFTVVRQTTAIAAGVATGIGTSKVFSESMELTHKKYVELTKDHESKVNKAIWIVGSTAVAAFMGVSIGSLVYSGTFCVANVAKAAYDGVKSASKITTGAF